jgi:3-oxoacyl-[acyl-carrier-protein] synthase-1
MKLDDPTKASSPFDANRDGLVPSGGAATIILEDYDHAIRRGATIFGEVVGYGFSSNGTPGISQPDDTGSFIAMQRALEDANLKPQQIDYINAHATSTPQGDDTEAIAIARLFENCRTPVSSTKSMTGHECWMAGASEVVYSLLMMKNNFIAPNINFDTPNEFSAKINVIPKTLNANIDVFLSNSFGFGGTNSALVIKKL